MKTANEQERKRMDEALQHIMKNLIPSREAAKRLGVSQQQIGYLAREGRIVGTQVGREWIIYAPSIDTYLASKGAGGRPGGHKTRKPRKTGS